MEFLGAFQLSQLLGMLMLKRKDELCPEWNLNIMNH